MLFFSVEGRPTQELFFTTEEGHAFCIGEKGSITAVLQEDLMDMRWSPIDVSLRNDDTAEAIAMAKAHASANNWVLSDTFYYD